MALNLTNNDEVCIQSLSSILLAVHDQNNVEGSERDNINEMV